MYIDNKKYEICEYNSFFSKNIKFLKKPNENKISYVLKHKKKLEDEIKILKHLDKKKNKNIIKIEKIIDVDKILFKYYNKGDLYLYIRNKIKYDEEDSIMIFKKILNIVNFLYKEKIIHRDLKPDNFLIDENNELVLIDFEFATFYEEDKKMYLVCGTPEYISPEAVYEYGYDYKSEIWSLGVIFFILNYGYYPFGKFRSFDEVQDKIEMMYNFNIKKYYGHDYEIDNLEIIKKMLCFEPSERIDLKELNKIFENE